jgi:glutamate/tyrosine decarboxylase-like PLP-dependent enzyme
MSDRIFDLLIESAARFNAELKRFGDFQIDDAITDRDLSSLLEEYVDRLSSNYPFAHPAYAGQMLKPPHPVAWLGYSLAMLVNGNNHALDGGPDTSAMEKEVIREFVDFFEFPEHSLGHLTASGTIANLEALWIARCIHPDRAIAFSKNAHYTHSRMCDVLGLNSIMLEEDENGNPSIEHLRSLADQIGTLVVTMGTTGLGKVEPLDQLLPICRSQGIRVHVDAAYGGFFKLLVGTGLINDEPWKYIGLVDSLVVDPHKHGLQPYGCGCVLFRDPSIGHFYKHDSPYTYFTSEELHLGEISLECSRAGASAAALWLTLKAMPLKGDLGLKHVLLSCRTAALEFADMISNEPSWFLYEQPELDIVTYFPQAADHQLGTISSLSQKVMKSGMSGPEKDRLFVSLYSVSSPKLLERLPSYRNETKTDRTSILRSVFMKDSHRSYLSELLRRLNHHLVDA